jgi:hypothetical protein
MEPIISATDLFKIGTETSLKISALEAAVRRRRTRIRLLVPLEYMHSTIGATHQEEGLGSA